MQAASSTLAEQLTSQNGPVLDALKWRLIGPFRGGRVVAVAGHPTEPATFYFGACAGGVWKSTDGGAYWENVSDGFFNTAAVGAIAISESDPNVIYAGTGETSIRGNVSHGDGVYKSTDGGKTWRNSGLSDTHAISRIRIHPQNPEIVYVGALGHVWGPNEERGVFRSTDGGESWKKILFRSPKAGVIDLTMDPHNPRILYAATWEAQRTPYSLNSGGEGSGIFKTTDGGDTWAEITRNPGLPEGTIGKVGIAISPAQKDRVYAIVEAEDGALFRSDDGGDTWLRLSEEGDLRRRAWYYQHMFADPVDPNTCWVLNLKCWKSIDGGKTFSAVPTPHGDNHDLWIDPNNPQRMIEGNDGGACVTYNGGLSWSSIYNQPTSQFYHVTTDDRTPYYVYGSQQDNTALALPSASARGAITQSEWFEPGGGESGYIAIKPTDENIVVGGAIGSGPGHGRLIRYDHRNKEFRIITVWPELQGMGRGAKDLKYRFQWTFPIMYSQHDPDSLYVTSQYVHRSTDEGASWEVISPDLTRNDVTKMESSGGPITQDNTGAETYGTIFAFVESPLQPGLFWAGSDDGLIHISRDGGANWENITPPDLPEWALISVIEPSPHDAGTAYVAATRYKLDDFSPYLYKTTDYGQTWEKITGGIPGNDFTRVIREDPSRKGLLYAGTETGIYVSFDDGANWQRFQANLPVVPIHDLIIKGTDLIVATHGRAFWILDDLSPLHQMQDEILSQPVHLFQPRTASRFKNYGRFNDPAPPAKSYGRAGGMVVTFYQQQNENGETEFQFLDSGKNPPDGALVYYWLKDKPEGEVKLTFSDAQGNEIRSFSSQTENGLRAPAKAGLNRFLWNLRYPSASTVPGHDMMPDSIAGPVAVPGQYSVTLSVNGETQSESFEIVADPRVAGSQEDLQAQFDLLLKIRDKLSQTHDAINRLRDIREQVNGWEKRLKDEEVSTAAADLKKKLAAIEIELIQPEAASPLVKPSGLNDKLAGLPLMIGNTDTRPTSQSYEVFDKLSGEIDEQLDKLASLIDSDLAAFNEMLEKKSVRPVVA